MKHNISLYDTGRVGSYSHRNEGWTIASIIAGVVITVASFIMMMAGLFDPNATFGVFVAGAALMGLNLANATMFLTHRNFGLTERGTEAMDAIYSLPKEERKQYKFSKSEVSALSRSEVNRLVGAVEEYRSSRSTGNAIGRLTNNIIDYNNTVRDMELR